MYSEYLLHARNSIYIFSPLCEPDTILISSPQPPFLRNNEGITILSDLTKTLNHDRTGSKLGLEILQMCLFFLLYNLLNILAH